MLVPIDSESLLAYSTRRPDYADIALNTRQAIACYFEGMALRLLILPYPKEEDTKFSWRRERMLEMYDNYTKEVAETYVEGVFRTKSADRKTGNERFDEYLNGEYADWFNDELAIFSLFVPELYVVCTVPPAKGKIDNEADKKALQGLPYPSIYLPHYCVNMGFDGVGELAWACFYVDEPLDPSDPASNPSSIPAQTKDAATKKRVLYELYTADYKIVFDQDGNALETLEHGYGFLPVVRICYRKNQSSRDPIRTGHAFMHSITKLSLGGLAAKGALQDFQYYALFPKLVTGTITSENMVEMGTGPATPLVVPGEGAAGGVGKEVPPYYLSAPTNEFEALERIAYERIPTAVYRSARLRDRTTNKSIRAESGVAKMFDMVPELGVLKAVAKYFRKSDLSICKMLYRLMDGDPDNVQIEYPSTFDTKSLSETMAELVEGADAMKALSLPSSKTGTLEVAKRWYKSEIPDMPDAFYKTVFEELEAALQEPDVPIDDEAAKDTLTEGEPSEPLPIGVSPSFPAVAMK